MPWPCWSSVILPVFLSLALVFALGWLLSVLLASGSLFDLSLDSSEDLLILCVPCFSLSVESASPSLSSSCIQLR